MNKLFSPAVWLSLMGATVFVSCKDDIPQGEDPVSYAYAQLDENGGDWNPILVDDVNAIAIPAPDAVGSAAYDAELDEVLSLNSNLSASQREALDYWGNNTAVRWMDIAENLVSQYFLPPPPGPEGNYPPPSAANPDQIPYFPFAHPPYAARMFAYLSAGMYDAAIASWHFKYAYDRPNPYEAVTGIQPYFPANDLPGYPSEDAAMAFVAQKILTAMFPREADVIAEYAATCRESRKWAGLAVESDLVAGDSIGAYVARVFLNRSRNDNMKFAQTDKPTYEALKAEAAARWGDAWPVWENLEIPQRPVAITPKYGEVLPWWIPNVEAVRPGPPPAIGSPEYLENERELLDLTKRATREQKEIAFYWSDGPGTVSPPGHWNDIATESILENRFNPLRTARVYAYLNTAVQDAGISCWDTKFYYFYPRPSQANPEIKTLFGIPNFPSYTSGHSTFSGAAAEVLASFFPEKAAYFEEQAEEAGMSRLYSGIHFRFDAEVGVAVGHDIGGYAVSAAAADGF
jgi:hypothetical protein